MSKNTREPHTPANRQSTLIKPYAWQKILRTTPNRVFRAAALASASDSKSAVGVPNILLVGYTMSTYANFDNGASVRPGDENIAADTGLSLSTVARARGILEQLEFIELDQKGYPGSASEYRLTDPSLSAGDGCIRSTPVASDKNTRRQRERHPSPATKASVASDDPPEHHQNNYQNTHQSVRNSAITSEDVQIEEVMHLTGCTSDEARAIVFACASDPSTKRKDWPVARLRVDPDYCDQLLETERDQLRRRRSLQTNKLLTRLQTAPGNPALCKCGQVDGLAPQNKGLPRCSTCRTDGRPAISLTELETWMSMEDHALLLEAKATVTSRPTLRSTSAETPYQQAAVGGEPPV